MMKSKKHIFLLSLICLQSFLLNSCSSVRIIKDEVDCLDTGEDFVTGNLSAQISGDACNAPAIIDEETDEQLALTCIKSLTRTTTDSNQDFITLTCTLGSETVSQDYYCLDGVVYKKEGTEDLFPETEVECTQESPIELVERVFQIG